jgi:tripartite ATP-independent transporter DctP family solute receptor
MNTSPSPLSRRSFIRLAGGAIAGAAFGAGSPAQAAQELKLTHPADLSHPVHLAAVSMVKKIDERTHGEIKITIFPNNALGSPPETAQQTRLGAIDFLLGNPANFEAFSKSIGVINIPYQFDSYEHAHHILDVTARDWVSDQLRKAGLIWVANSEWGFRSFSNSVRPINKPDDIKGLKIRVPPELAIKAAFEALGGITQTIAFQELYLALANKTVDAQDNPVGTTFAAKFYEVQKHIALTKHIYAPIMMVSNPRAWEKLTPAQRAIVSEEAAAAGVEARRGVRDNEEVYLAEMQKTGVQVTRPDVAPFRERMAPAYDQLKKMIGDETWNTWAKLVAAGRK